MQARIFELTDSLQAATEALAAKDAAHAAQLSALRTEKNAALAAQAKAFQAELEALKASARAGSVDIGGDQGQDRPPSAAPHDIELAIVGEEEGRQSQQQRQVVPATEEEEEEEEEETEEEEEEETEGRKEWNG